MQVTWHGTSRDILTSKVQTCCYLNNICKAAQSGFGRIHLIHLKSPFDHCDSIQLSGWFSLIHSNEAIHFDCVSVWSAIRLSEARLQWNHLIISSFLHSFKSAVHLNKSLLSILTHGVRMRSASQSIAITKLSDPFILVRLGLALMYSYFVSSFCRFWNAFKDSAYFVWPFYNSSRHENQNKPNKTKRKAFCNLLQE